MRPGQLHEIELLLLLQDLADISRELTFDSPEGLMEGWFRGMEPKILERTPIGWGCSCSRERMEKTLISLGRKELTELSEDPAGADVRRAQR